MIRDNVYPAARYRIPPESDELAAQRVSEYTGISMAGLTFHVYASIQQLCRALEEGTSFRILKQKLVFNGGAWSKIWQIDGVAKDSSCWSFHLWQKPNEVTVLGVGLTALGKISPKAKKEYDELIGE